MNYTIESLKAKTNVKNHTIVSLNEIYKEHMKEKNNTGCYSEFIKPITYTTQI